MTTLAMPVAASVTGYVTSPANSRRRGGSPATATATRRLAIVATLDLGPDRLEVIARDDDFRGSLSQARRHARTLARTLADRRHASVVVQVLAEDGDLLHHDHAVASLGPVAEALVRGQITDATRATILAGFAQGLTEGEIVRQLLSGRAFA